MGGEIFDRRRAAEFEARETAGKVRRRIKRVHIERLVPVQLNEDELAYEEDA